jgi:tetratricopeptide (TPR) repeat protein
MARASAGRRDKQGQKKRKKRQWGSPPPLIRDSESPGPEGLAIIGEISSSLGGILWKAYRSMLLWAETDEADRVDLYGKRNAESRRRREIDMYVPDEEIELREPLEVLLALIAAPEEGDRSEVAHAAHRIAKWAALQGYTRTQMEFLCVAALSEPTNARYAYLVGTTARSRGQLGMAEAWYVRAIALARRSKEWDPYIRAYLEHGLMMLDKGALPTARGSLIKAYRRAVRQGLRKPRAESLRGLVTLEVAADDPIEAAKHAEEAAGVLNPSDPEATDLVREVVHFWLRSGYFEPALVVLRELAEAVPRPLLPEALGAFARAAAGAGDEAAFEEARERLSRLTGGPGVPEAWLEVGRAASHLGKSQVTEEAAAHADRLSRQQPGSQIGFMAGILRQQSAANIGLGDPAEDEGGHQASLAETLASLLREARHS